MNIFRPLLPKVVALAISLTACSSGQSLRESADQAGVLLGAAVRAPQLSEPLYASTLSREYNLVEAEDAMKWWVLRPDRETFDFRQGDEIVRFARAHNMRVRGHCLVWGRYNPDWLARGQFNPDQLSQLLRDHITRVMRHYAGEVFAWDVVNEAFDENGVLRDSLWYNQPGIGLAGRGTAYIEQVFRWAHQADPHALLFYNEAEGELLGRKSDAIYAMVRDFKQRGVPIDGVGLQLHIPNLDLDSSALSANIARLTRLGLQVHITELDVSLPLNVDAKTDAENLDRQAQIYRSVVHACLSNPGCTAIQTWGFTDKYSWIGSHSRGTRGDALPFDRSCRPKPAYNAMREEFAAGRSGPHQ
ncbi:MAG TPA: endo-1,4-beta-xylanase [Candidatus Binatia bacterium]|nr:endo-1,4-beta-xylanase [Candidatus Binatia bacterium]